MEEPIQESITTSGDESLEGIRYALLYLVLGIPESALAIALGLAFSALAFGFGAAAVV